LIRSLLHLAQGGKVMAAQGVTVQVMPCGEIYLALDRAAIDALNRLVGLHS
jgi:TRAP-type mannitol/chloroaromatic compound transport system substrate-binding protein